jgi:uncharacterized protein YndB with AHSA1/START domain
MDAVERHVTLPADLEGAWELLTRPDDQAGWLGAEVDLRPRPGAAGSVVDHDGTRRRLVVDEVDAGRRLTWHWAVEGDDGVVGPASQVEITLVPVEEGTRLTVVERPLEPAARAGVQASAGAAWSHRLLHLEALLLVAAAVRG